MTELSHWIDCIYRDDVRLMVNDSSLTSRDKCYFWAVIILFVIFYGNLFVVLYLQAQARTQKPSTQEANEGQLDLTSTWPYVTSFFAGLGYMVYIGLSCCEPSTRYIKNLRTIKDGLKLIEQAKKTDPEIMLKVWNWKHETNSEGR